MKLRNAVLGPTLLVALVGACQQPSDTAAPPVSATAFPGESPVAPAIEPGQPTPERPIDLPASPIAPAVEPGFVTPEPTISFDPG